MNRTKVDLLIFLCFDKKGRGEEFKFRKIVMSVVVVGMWIRVCIALICSINIDIECVILRAFFHFCVSYQTLF